MKTIIYHLSLLLLSRQVLRVCRCTRALPVGVCGRDESAGRLEQDAERRDAVRTFENVFGTFRVRDPPDANHALITRIHDLENNKKKKKTNRIVRVI